MTQEVRIETKDGWVYKGEVILDNQEFITIKESSWNTVLIPYTDIKDNGITKISQADMVPKATKVFVICPACGNKQTIGRFMGSEFNLNFVDSSIHLCSGCHKEMFVNVDIFVRN